MSGKLEFFLSGQVQLKLDGVPIDRLTSIKARALLIYLAVTGKAHSRSALAALLWSDMRETSARANLRMALSKLRKSIGNTVVADRQSIRLADPESHWVDVLIIENYCRRKNFESVPLEELRESARLYRGDFLDDFYVPGAPLYEEWVTLTRERFRQTAVDCLDFLVSQALEQENFSEGIGNVRQLLALDPWREESHRQLMILLARDGQRSAALAQYEICSQTLAQELGVEPSQETKDIYKKIREEEIKVAVDTTNMVSFRSKSDQPFPTPRHNLPAQTTPFVGRKKELDQITGLLSSPESRLLTITGPGGIGKTRLALESARHIIIQNGNIFPDGIWHIPLASIEKSSLLDITITQALHLSISGTKEPKEVLIDFLREKKLLLVLDNFEQILDGVDLILVMLERAPRINILVTSRERLNLYEEWLFELEGLSTPSEDTTTDEHFDSVQLFEQRAKRTFLGFDLSTELEAVGEICRIVEGMPLAIEMAAARTRVSSCQVIAEEIKKNIDHLSTSTRNIPPRQISIRASFLYSWQFLSTEEQEIYARLSVFRGGFTKESAEMVAKTPLRVLASLVDKSMLIRTSSGRYGFHALLRQLANEKLSEDQKYKGQLESIFGNYFINFLKERDQLLRGLEAEKAADQINTEIDNIRAAWNWAINTCDLVAISSGLKGLYYFYDLRVWYQGGERLIDQTIRILKDSGFTENILVTRLEARQAHFLSRLGETHKARILLESALPILRSSEFYEEYVDAINAYVNLLRTMGEYEVALPYIEECKTICQSIGYQQALAGVLGQHGLILGRTGKHNEALDLFLESVAAYRKWGPLKSLAGALNGVGSMYLTLGKFPEATTYLQECVEIADQIGYHSVQIAGLQNLGLVSLLQEDWQNAEEKLLESLHLAQDLGMRDMQVFILNDLAEFYLRTDSIDKACDCTQKALEMAREMGIRWAEANSLTQLGNMALVEDDVSGAEEFYRKGIYISQDISATSITMEILIGWADILSRKGLDRDAWQILIFLSKKLKNDADRLAMANKVKERIIKRVPKSTLEEIDAQDQELTLESLVEKMKADSVH